MSATSNTNRTMTRHSVASTSSSSSSSSSPSPSPSLSPLESYFVALSVSVDARQKRAQGDDDDETSCSRKLTLISDQAKVPTQRLCQQVSLQQQQQQQQNVSLPPYKRSTVTRLPSPKSITDEIFCGGNENFLQSPRSARWGAISSPSPSTQRAPHHLLEGRRMERSATPGDGADRAMLLELLRMDAPVLALPSSPVCTNTCAAGVSEDATSEEADDSFNINLAVHPPITPSMPPNQGRATASSNSTIKQLSSQPSRWNSRTIPVWSPTPQQRSRSRSRIRSSSSIVITSSRRQASTKTNRQESSLQDLSTKMMMMMMTPSYNSNDSPRSAAARWNAIDSSSQVKQPSTTMTDNDSPLSCPIRSSTTTSTTTKYI